jgi:hypothetical protein
LQTKILIAKIKKLTLLNKKEKMMKLGTVKEIVFDNMEALLKSKEIHNPEFGFAFWRDKTIIRLEFIGGQLHVFYVPFELHDWTEAEQELFLKGIAKNAGPALEAEEKYLATSAYNAWHKY